MSPWPVEAEVEEVHLPRPGHADLAGAAQVRPRDVRNVLERASARETAARVAAGALAKGFLRALGVSVHSHVLQIGARARRRRATSSGRTTSTASTTRPCAASTPTRARRWSPRSTGCGRRTRASAASSRCARSGSCPGSARTRPGTSGSTRASPRRWSRSRRSRASRSARRGTSPAGPARRRTTRSSGARSAAGIARRTAPAGSRAGCRTASRSSSRAAMKPLSTLTKPLRSVDTETKQPAEALRERTDSTTVPAAGVVGEAMVALVLARCYREKFGGDHIDDVLGARRGLQGAHRMAEVAIAFVGFMGAGKARPLAPPPPRSATECPGHRPAASRASSASRSPSSSSARARRRSASTRSASCSICSPKRRGRLARRRRRRERADQRGARARTSSRGCGVDAGDGVGALARARSARWPTTATSSRAATASGCPSTSRSPARSCPRADGGSASAPLRGSPRFAARRTSARVGALRLGRVPGARRRRRDRAARPTPASPLRWRATRWFAIADVEVLRHHPVLLPPCEAVIEVEAGEERKTLAEAERVLRELAGAGVRRDDGAGRARRRRRRRPGRLLRRDLPARRPGRPGPDDARRPGRLRLRRQDRRRPPRGEELRRRVPPAGRGAHRSRRARDAPRRRSSPPASPRS